MRRLIALILVIGPFFASAEMQRSYEVVSEEFNTNIPSGKCMIKGKAIDVSTDKYISDIDITFYKSEEILDVTGWGGRFRITVDSGSVSLRFEHSKFSSNAFMITAKDRHEIEILVYMRSKDRPMTTRKPVIYLYPRESTSVSVDVDFVGDITFSYPKINEGWSVVAHPNGTMEHNNRLYPYLFWEGNQRQFMSERNSNEGFVISSDEVVSFLEEKLDRYGLSNREVADFITYWAPVLEQNEFNYIHFLFDEEYGEFISKMEIHPKPDQIMRIYMAYQPLRRPIDVVPQEIPSTERNGFTVVEWGGGEVLAFPGE